MSEWIDGLGARVYVEAPEVLPLLWPKLALALEISASGQDASQIRSWADAALNAPVGKMMQVLFRDPETKELQAGIGFPETWMDYVEVLLTLPDVPRGHALVFLGHHLRWCYFIDPKWTAQHLIPVIDDHGRDGDALWEGIFWANELPQKALYPLLKPAMIAGATTSRRRREGASLAAFLLAGWGSGQGTREQLVSDDELREVLIHAADAFRGSMLWQLKQWSLEAESGWRDRIVLFLERVWPKQRALRSTTMSRHLADLVFASGDLMPDVAKLIVPRLVPVEHMFLPFENLEEEPEKHPARCHPQAVLDILCAMLSEDPQKWPTGALRTLEILSEMPATSSDPRLADLRRRIELS